MVTLTENQMVVLGLSTYIRVYYFYSEYLFGPTEFMQKVCQANKPGTLLVLWHITCCLTTSSDNPHATSKVSNSYLQTYLTKTYGCCHLSHAAGTETSQICANTSRQAPAPSSLATTGADGSLGCKWSRGQVSSEDFQHQETTRFPSRNISLKTGPESSLPAGTREEQLLWLQVHPGGHGANTASATPALWAQERRRLPQQGRCYSRELQRPWGCAQEALPTPQLALSLKKRTFIKKGRKKPQNLFVLFPGHAIKKKEKKSTAIPQTECLDPNTFRELG